MIRKLLYPIVRKYQIAKCVLFHDKEIKKVEWMVEPIHFDGGEYKGCRKCDIWRKI